MMLFNTIFLFFNIALTSTYSIGSKSDSWKSCSKFDFEEKVLEKLVRIELKIEIFDKKMKDWEEKMNNFENVELKRTRDIQMKIEKQGNDDMERHKDIVDNVIKNITLDASGVFEILATKQENQIKVADEKLANMQNKLDEIETSHNYSSIQLTKLMNNITARSEKVVDETLANIQHELLEIERSQKNQLIQFMDNVTEKAGFSACEGSITNQIITFREVQYVNGIAINSAYHKGIFYAQEKGFYVVIVNILIYDDTGFYIWHNTKRMAVGWPHFAGSKNGAHMASTSVFVKLEINDTVSVKAYDSSMRIDPSSCLTIFKL